MKLSTKGRYGTRVLLDIAFHEGKTPVLLRHVAERQDIPLAYVKRLAALLVGAGIIRSTRGAGGGVSLARNPRHIALKEAVDVLEGTVPLAECITNPAVCERSYSCATRDIWSEVDAAASQVLESTTLQDLIDRQVAKRQVAGTMYNI